MTVRSSIAFACATSSFGVFANALDKEVVSSIGQQGRNQVVNDDGLGKAQLRGAGQGFIDTKEQVVLERQLQELNSMDSHEIKHATVTFAGVEGIDDLAGRFLLDVVPNYERLLDDIPKQCGKDFSASFTLSNGGTFTWDVDGCCCLELTECVPSGRGGSSDACEAGVEGSISSYNKFLEAPVSCYFTSCDLDDQNEFARQAFGGTCQPDIGFYTTVTEVADGIDNDCDGFIDDEQCDGIDNDGDGIVDEDRGSCLLRVVTFPMDWEGGTTSYEDFVQRAWTQFLAQSNVIACSDNFSLEIRTDNINRPTGTTCSECGLDVIVPQLDALIPVDERAQWDVIAVFTNRDICGRTAGCSNGRQIWIEVDKKDEYRFAVKDSILSHEIGHVLGLADQYCSQLAWVGNDPPEPRCSPRAGTPNPLSASLGCDPNKNSGCCDECDAYQVCCKGNESVDGAGRSIMSGAGDEDAFPKGWDQNEVSHITNFTNGRTEANPFGKIVMDCEYVFEGIRELMLADARVDPISGSISVESAWAGKGRPAPGGSNDNSLNYCVQVEQDGQMLGDYFFQLERGYTGPQYQGVDYTDLDAISEPRLLSLTIPTSTINLSPAPVQFKAMIRPNSTSPFVPVSSSCTTPGPGGNLLPDRSPPVITGCYDEVVECSALGGTPKDDAQLISFFEAVEANDSCDPNPILTNDAPLLFQARTATTVKFTAQDSDDNTATCSGNVRVEDTTRPTISVGQAEISLWPPNGKYYELDLVLNFTVTSEDICCGGDIALDITAVESNKDISKGQNADEDDIYVSSETSFMVRARRDGYGDDRVYVINFDATDCSGQVSSAQVYVIVPHDQSEEDMAGANDEQGESNIFE